MPFCASRPPARGGATDARVREALEAHERERVEWVRERERLQQTINDARVARTHSPAPAQKAENDAITAAEDVAELQESLERANFKVASLAQRLEACEASKVAELEAADSLSAAHSAAWSAKHEELLAQLDAERQRRIALEVESAAVAQANGKAKEQARVILDLTRAAEAAHAAAEAATGSNQAAAAQMQSQVERHGKEMDALVHKHDKEVAELGQQIDELRAELAACRAEHTATLAEVEARHTSSSAAMEAAHHNSLVALGLEPQKSDSGTEDEVSMLQRRVDRLYSATDSAMVELGRAAVRQGAWTTLIYDDADRGPTEVPIGEVSHLLTAGKMTAHTLVMVQGMQNWAGARLACALGNAYKC